MSVRGGRLVVLDRGLERENLFAVTIASGLTMYNQLGVNCRNSGT